MYQILLCARRAIILFIKSFVLPLSRSRRGLLKVPNNNKTRTNVKHILLHSSHFLKELFIQVGSRAGSVSGTNFVFCSYEKFKPGYQADVSPVTVYIRNFSSVTDMNKARPFNKFPFLHLNVDVFRKERVKRRVGSRKSTQPS